VSVGEVRERLFVREKERNNDRSTTRAEGGENGTGDEGIAVIDREFGTGGEKRATRYAIECRYFGNFRSLCGRVVKTNFRRVVRARPAGTRAHEHARENDAGRRPAVCAGRPISYRRKINDVRIIRNCQFLSMGRSLE